MSVVKRGLKIASGLSLYVTHKLLQVPALSLRYKGETLKNLLHETEDFKTLSLSQQAFWATSSQKRRRKWSSLLSQFRHTCKMQKYHVDECVLCRKSKLYTRNVRLLMRMGGEEKREKWGWLLEGKRVVLLCVRVDGRGQNMHRPVQKCTRL